ncbi:MAG: response regulator [bacterium]|nr:response regulator [bacterium]
MDQGAEAVTDRVRPGRILLVEDDLMLSLSLHRALSADKHTVEVCHDGVDAMQRFSPGHFDVALIDLGIPTVPGDRVAGDLRARDPALVTVLITGWSLAQDDPRLSSFDFHLPKPIMGPDLKGIVTKVMALHDSRV